MTSVLTSQKVLLIHPDAPEKSFWYTYESSSLESGSIADLYADIKAKKKVQVEFTDCFSRSFSLLKGRVYSEDSVASNISMDYAKALQPFYITNIRELKDGAPQEKHQIFVRSVSGKILTFNVHLGMDVEYFFGLIEEKSGCRADMCRLVFGGKQLDAGMTLGSYGVQNESTLELSLRLIGGRISADAMVTKFVDITKEDKAVIVPWAKTGPKYLEAAPGLCLQGKCKTKECEAFNKWVVVNKGFGTYDVVDDEHTNSCPSCKSYVECTFVAFNNCLYSYAGTIYNGPGKKPMKKISQQPTKVGHVYKRFDPDNAGVISWRTLKIVTQTLEKEDPTNSQEPKCQVCNEKASNKPSKKLTCEHHVHTDCQKKCSHLNVECVICNA